MSTYTPHALSLPQSFPPDTLDTLTDLSTILQKVHATAQESLSDPQSQTQKPADASKLTFKDVPNATDPIKHKLQRAREQVRQLPDMGRTVQEQDKEIAELEARILRQRELLNRLREGGLAFGRVEGERMETS